MLVTSLFGSNFKWLSVPAFHCTHGQRRNNMLHFAKQGTQPGACAMAGGITRTTRLGARVQADAAATKKGVLAPAQRFAHLMFNREPFLVGKPYREVLHLVGPGQDRKALYTEAVRVPHCVWRGAARVKDAARQGTNVRVLHGSLAVRHDSSCSMTPVFTCTCRHTSPHTAHTPAHTQLTEKVAGA